MLSRISSNGEGIEAYTDPGYVPSSGIVRWNNNGRCLEVMVGEQWMRLDGGSVTIGADPVLRDIMNWAKIKMAEEQQLAALMEKHPGLKDTKEKFDIMYALVKNGDFKDK